MSERINRIFSKVSNDYDRMNHILSFGADISWRNSAVNEILDSGRRGKVLDIGTGTADLAIAISKSAKNRDIPLEIEGIDFNEAMLKIGKRKLRDLKIYNVKIKLGNALSLKYPDNYFDIVTSGFTLRNLDDLEVFTGETYRVLKRGGKIVLLEMAKPDSALEMAFFEFYSRYMRALGSFVDSETYNWLVYSIKRFDKNRLVSLLRSAGFKGVKIRNLVSGIAFLVTGTK